MKTIKVTLMSIIVLAGLASIFAFAPNLSKSSGKNPGISKITIKNKKVLLGQWYKYTGPVPVNWASAIQSANYSPLSPWEDIYDLCVGSQTICAIFADRDPSFPNRPLIISNSYLYDALNNYFTYGYADPTFITLKDYQ